jgi:tetratricopeptide (TPR) repeat protein
MGEELEMSRTYNNIGNSYFYAGDMTVSLKEYRAALRIQRRLNSMLEVASTLSNLGSVYCVKGNLTRGTFLFEKSLELKMMLGDAGEIARTLNNLGYVHNLCGRFGDAVNCLTESLQINRRIGSQKEVLFNLDNLTAVMQEAGQLPASLKYLEQGLTLSREVNDLPHQLMFSHSLAVTNLRLGKPVECSRLLESVSGLMEKVEDPHILLQAQLTSVNLRLLLGDIREAHRIARDTVGLAREKGMKPFLLQTLLALMRTDDAPDSFEELKSLAKELDQPNDLALGHFNRVEYLLETDRLGDPLLHLEGLRGLFPGLPPTIERPRLRNIYAGLLIASGKFTEARPVVELNRAEAREFGLLPEYARTLVLAGQLQSVEGNVERAYVDYRQALQILKSISDSLQNDQDRASFQTKRTVRFLMAEIRRLGKLLGQKQRAGHPALP